MFFKRLGIFCSIVLVLFVIGYINTLTGEMSAKPSEESETSAPKPSEKSEMSAKPSEEESETIKSPEQLEDRINEYWQYRIEREFVKCYPYEHPEFREKVSPNDYIKWFVGGMGWRKATVQSVATEGDLASVSLEINYYILGIYMPKEGLTQTITEYWQLCDNNWYHQFKSPKRNIKTSS